MTLERMDNVGIMVESLDAAISFFTERGLKLEGRSMIEGEWAGRTTGWREARQAPRTVIRMRQVPVVILMAAPAPEDLLSRRVDRNDNGLDADFAMKRIERTFPMRHSNGRLTANR